ncbi:ABC transporter [Thermothelomyces thermophilus ATCC 42464]|uniref:ABC transporter n=1 Tax=Thermothelomyces thermophilus (strain ATCC 42464 / BCRC 31852 / DSM 1799) TaxID=573729 RepID=G2QMQ8_THET4|nr:ABC transporter [Thermothelomyces thermophilus ATCC 42464]AEO61238.1 ABC transporter [Thermothelomyces thermophilus ATCC 42464]
MAQPSPVSCVRVDDSFGPHAGDCRGGFDFTLLFEETILRLAPAGLLLIALPLRVWYLSKLSRKLVSAKRALPIKIVAWILLGSLQLATLVLWALPSAARTTTTLPSAAVVLASTVGLCVLSSLEHTRLVRPSTSIGVFLFATLLCDIAYTRTLWLRAGDQLHHNIAILATAAVATKASILVLEALDKRGTFRPEFQDYPPEATSSIFNRAFFWWLNPLFKQGFRRDLDVDDLFLLDKHLRASYGFARFQSIWNSITEKSPYSLLWASYRVLKWPVLQTILPRACYTALSFCQPFLINHAIVLSQEPVTNVSTQKGYGLIGAYILVYGGIALAMGQYQHRTYRSIAMLRAGLVSIIYRKTSTVSLRGIDPATSMTLMSADIERIVQGFQTMHEIWGNSIEVALAIYLLERQLGVACVVPVAVSIFSLLGSIVAMNFIMSRQAMWLEAIEKRISATSAMLSSMKGVKMCGLKDTLLSSLQQLRVDELRISKKFRRLIIWNMLFAYMTQVFAPVLTFLVFSIRARDTGDKTLDTARVFTSLSLFALLSEPLASLVMALAAYLGAVGSFVRIQQFLESEERPDMRKPEAEPTEKPRIDESAADAVVVQGGSFGWDPEKEPILEDITMSVPWRKLTMVVGPVGCGKSTLLLSILGEVPALAGSVRLGSASVAYCSQDPWHMNGTIRQAIVGCEEYDEMWYARVVHACSLRRDFRELPLGDSTKIGSGGIALSGGQSQRIALARAVYARRKIVILDDVLGGLDNTTENHVFHSLLGEKGLLRGMEATVLLVSSSAKRLPYSDHIVCLGSDGKIDSQGTFAQLDAAGGYVSSFCLPRADWAYTPEDEDQRPEVALEKLPPSLTTVEDRSGVEGDSSASSTSSKTAYNNNSNNNNNNADGGDGMSRRTGDIQIYLYYIKSVGWWATLIFVFAISGFAFCLSFPTIWVEWWAAYNEDDPNGNLGYWLGIYAMLGGVAIICLVLSCWQMIMTMVPRSGEKFHFALLSAVLNNPMSFFVNTDSGVTLNRFSQDLQLIDMELPISALNTFATLVMCLAQMALIGYGSVYAAISFPVVLVSLYIIQKVYLRTSRQLRLMDLETKAPLYSLFEESLNGIATIRAFRWQDKLNDKNHELLDRSQRPFYLLFSVQRWLTLVLDLVVAAIAVLLVVLVVALRGTLAAGGVGLALLNVIQFSQNIKLLVSFWTTLETHIGSVARIKSFTETAVPEDLPEENQQPPPGWPSAGAIEFSNLSASYNRDELVLKEVCLSIKAGEKIGICGRTGSGKTSLIMTLFRLVDMQGGSISVDGVDISTLPRQEVRSKIVAVPQHPFLLKGSVRLNADPMGQASDQDITAALQCVQLMEAVEKNGGLDADIDDLNLSVGQKQLFCLARAMLRPSTILILDEATSSIDAKTEETMQRLIRRKFANHTVIAVAHRIETIMDFDKVAVLDAGRLVEFDNPYKLLESPGSAFTKLYCAALAEEEEDLDKKRPT